MRSENQSIMVGSNTVLLDNPSLTVRDLSGKSPIRVALDRQGRIPEKANLLDGSVPTIVFSEVEKPNGKHLEFVKVDFENDVLSTILQKLYLSLIHISEPTRRTPISYAVFCLKK